MCLLFIDTHTRTQSQPPDLTGCNLSQINEEETGIQQTGNIVRNKKNERKMKQKC